MITERNILTISNALCAGAIVLSPLLVSRAIGMSGLFAFPMHVGIIFLGATLLHKRWKKGNKWDGAVPRPLRYMLPAMALFGAAGIAFGFAGILPSAAPSGEPVHHLSAYFENGLCYAVFNKVDVVQMSTEFCENFEIHFASVFSGFWLLFSAVLNWASWKCQVDDVVAIR